VIVGAPGGIEAGTVVNGVGWLVAPAPPPSLFATAVEYVVDPLTQQSTPDVAIPGTSGVEIRKQLR